MAVSGTEPASVEDLSLMTGSEQSGGIGDQPVSVEDLKLAVDGVKGLTSTYWTGNFGLSNSYSSNPLAANTYSASGISAVGNALTMPDTGTYRCFFAYGSWNGSYIESYEAYLMVGNQKVSMKSGSGPDSMTCACVDFTAQAGTSVLYYVNCDHGALQGYQHFYSALWRVG